MRLLRSKVTFAHFFDFGAQKSLLGEKVTFPQKVTFGRKSREIAGNLHFSKKK